MLLTYLIQADFHYLGWVLLGYFGSLFGATTGWFFLMRSLDSPVSWWQNVRIFLKTLAYRRFPGTLWYVGGRLAMYQELGIPKITIVFSSTVEVIVTIVSGLVVSLLFFVLSGAEMPYQFQLIILTVITLGVFFLLPWLTRKLVPLFKGNFLQDLDRKKLMLCFGGMAFGWIAGGLMIGSMVASFQPIHTTDFAYIIGLWGIAGTAGYLVLVLPSSFGVTDITLALLLSRIIPLPLAGVITILVRLMTTGFEVAFSLLVTIISRLSLKINTR